MVYQPFVNIAALMTAAKLKVTIRCLPEFWAWPRASSTSILKQWLFRRDVSHSSSILPEFKQTDLYHNTSY